MQPVFVMVNGLPGNMAARVAAHVQKDAGFKLHPASLTGPEITAPTARVGDIDIRLIRPEKSAADLADIAATTAPLIVVDYTHPTAVNGNAELYCRCKIPFVMGTTGGDRERLLETARAAGIAAVIAPNMAKQIVGFQAMMAYAAQTFPNLFQGYTLSVRESHQQGKADTSGTAKAMVGYFNQLGLPYDESEIDRERDPASQRSAWGIPEEYLGGHAWHTYALTSDDGTVRFEFTHNVNGREIYARGTLDALRYLAAKIRQGATGVFTMIDVLKGV